MIQWVLSANELGTNAHGGSILRWDVLIDTLGMMWVVMLIPICFYPVMDFLRHSLRSTVIRIIAAMAAMFAATYFIFLLMPDCNEDLFFYGDTAVCLGLYIYEVKLDIWKKLFAFATACYCGAYATLMGLCADMKWNPQGSAEAYSLLIFAAQAVILIAINIIFYHPLRRRIGWLFINHRDTSVWRIAWILPAVLTAMDMYVVPLDYSNLLQGRVLELYVLLINGVSLTTFILFFSFCELLYTNLSRDRMREERNLLSMQSSQYENLLNSLKETSRVRHDFQHHLAVLSNLIGTKKFEEAEQYMKDYLDTQPAHMITRYVESPSINALLSYTADSCREAGIHADFRLNVPDAEYDRVEDMDLCIILGNLLKNAYQSCEKIVKLGGSGGSSAEPYIRLRAALSGPNCGVFSISNPYAGELRQRGSRFLSTSHGGDAQGLESVRILVEKYHGDMKISTENGVFSVRFMIYLREPGRSKPPAGWEMDEFSET